ncbi:MAG: hypothetical protein ACOCRX_07045 [Candidatus Woesearchaeota archaeon]
MKVYMCRKCGYTGLPIGMTRDGVYFLGCPNCDSPFKNMKLIGEFDDNGDFNPEE